MTLFYNLTNIEKAASCNAIKYIQIISRLHRKQLLPKNKYELDITKMIGESFLLNPTELLLDKTTDINYKVQYLKLAGMRDYSQYKIYRVKTLPLSFYPDIDIYKIKHNPLLKITTTDIHFKYER